jgi:hypothetical protein
MNMQTRVVHAILSGIIIASVLGLALIPATWKVITEEPTFGPAISSMTIIEITASVAIIAITLLSFKLVRREK